MGIMEQVDAMRRGVVGFVTGDGSKSEAIADGWSLADERNIEQTLGRLPGLIDDSTDPIGRAIANDHRLLHEWSRKPMAIAGAVARVDADLLDSTRNGEDPRPLVNRMLYDLAVQKFARQTLREDGRARIPVEIYDLVGAKAGDRVLNAVMDLDRPLRERIAAGSMESLPRDFLATVTEPLPRLERNHSDSDRRRESFGAEKVRGSTAKGFTTVPEMAHVVSQGIQAGR